MVADQLLIINTNFVGDMNPRKIGELDSIHGFRRME